MGAALRETVEERFLISSYVHNLESTYTRLLAIPAEDLGWRTSYWSGELGMYIRWLVSTMVGRIGKIASRATGGDASQPHAAVSGA
jgi:hypothetical protein